MLDFAAVRRKETTIAELVKDLTPADLGRLTNAMLDLQLSLLAECQDADITFVPVDPEAHDAAAATAEAADLPWTLGHVIAHVTASAEEAAFLSAELARGVPVPDKHRSRYETPWETVTTVAHCRARLEESRRMRLACLEVWPAQPHLANTQFLSEASPRVNPLERFARGLSHDDAHLGQIREIARQARAARGPLSAA